MTINSFIRLGRHAHPANFSPVLGANDDWSPDAPAVVSVALRVAPHLDAEASLLRRWA